mgnify:FL=1
MYENNTKDIILAKQGDKEKFNELVENNKGLVYNIVKRFVGRGYEIDDLYQIGMMGFVKAIKRFDTDYEVKLSTYAVPYILGEIKRFIRDDGPVKVSRSLKELSTKISVIQKEYLTKGIELGIEEIASKLKVSKEEIAMAMESKQVVESIYSPTNSNDEDGINILDRISSNKDESEIITNNIALKEAISNLEEKEKEIILLRYYKDKTQTQVAKILGISQVQVSRIEKKILNSMKVKLIS